jgi:hypothetical protein
MIELIKVTKSDTLATEAVFHILRGYRPEIDSDFKHIKDIHTYSYACESIMKGLSQTAVETGDKTAQLSNARYFTAK